ncbi:kelch domain-containing protein 4 isoform X2 [Zootermopsis nevadensis]|nr:kelch domain-containing protein 4 isoform X2 [Zootermopsis nevadensis]XP_021917945.1 kelch domain-containing protein 4 isoform X2 [Zootermopsis nevadensis]
MKAPGGPPPRCSHQTVALSAGKGQLWVFGGEYASPTQSQFYHYNDLWVYHVSMKKWEKISASGGPSSRSGHRMVYIKKQLIVFGGFHDNLRDYKYFNDVYAFNLENYTWKRIEPTGTPPAPRSGCVMVALPNGKVLIYGGYSKEKIKRDVDKGVIHTDMFLLTPEKNDISGLKWKWVAVKQSGARISARCGMSVAVAPGNKAYAFGGVWDIEDSENDLAGTFYNDLLTLDFDKTLWRTVTLSGKKDSGKQRRRRKEKNELPNDVENDDSDNILNEMDTLELQDAVSDNGTEEVAAVPSASNAVVSDDGIFKVTVSSVTSVSTSQQNVEGSSEARQAFSPSPRMNCGLVVKHSILYLYGGLIEEGDKQFTLSDFYSLDLHKLDEWKTLIPNDLTSQEWLESDSSSDANEEDSGSDGDSESDEEQTQMVVDEIQQ